MEPSSDFIDTAAWIGRQQAFAVIASKCSAAQAQCLKQLKDSALHEKLGLTWDEFCRQHVGLSRPTADRLIQQYDEFGETYFRLSQLARISPGTYRQIAENVDDETITINGEEIALVPENARRIRAGLDRMRHQLREERSRTQPALIELRMRLDALLAEAANRVSRAMPTLQRDHLKQLALDAVRGWTRIAQAIDKLDAPRYDLED